MATKLNMLAATAAISSIQVLKTSRYSAFSYQSSRAVFITHSPWSEVFGSVHRSGVTEKKCLCV